MRILIYEFVTGGGWLHVESQPPGGSLLAEGSAMLAALAADLSAISDCQVDVLYDVRLPRQALGNVTHHPVSSAEAERQHLARLCTQVDWTVLIAPEFDEHLLARTRLVENFGGRLLSPNARVVALTTDKHATAEHLAQRDIRVPRGISLSPGDPLPVEFTYPAVLKPRDGAGSLGVRLVPGPDAEPATGRQRLEAYCAGTAASVACLCGPREIVPLEPCLQQLCGDGDFSYQGGSLPIEPPLAVRARTLAVQAVQTLPEPRGYVGVDLVLGVDPAGGQDYVIEINPRLTTSYVGLRRLSRENLAAQMIAVAEGRDAKLCWNASRIHFSASGVCSVSPSGETVP